MTHKKNMLSSPERFRLQTAMMNRANPFPTWSEAVEFSSILLRRPVTRQNIEFSLKAAGIELEKVVANHHVKRDPKLREEVQQLRSDIQQMQADIKKIQDNFNRLIQILKIDF